jgi:hypothetical protein
MRIPAQFLLRLSCGPFIDIGDNRTAAAFDDPLDDSSAYTARAAGYNCRFSRKIHNDPLVAASVRALLRTALEVEKNMFPS